ncbi:hypothetical protein TorRG33x02_248460 [Trema orientale]|uniref:Agenet-like domain containing protein n=1 Tax=Trema orientale TaxID=63057 RepID=A0A2P5DKG8_TREOI|nr:hypothetical protein TorRG33x02_248460 [Trema orientale]
MEELVRPPPPTVTGHSNYAVSQKVDAYEDGAWWVGRVSRIDGEDCLHCHVRLDISGNELNVPFYRLRHHLDWRDGHWVPPAPSRAPRPRSLSATSSKNQLIS